LGSKSGSKQLARGLGVGEHSRMTSGWMLYVSLVMTYAAIMVTIITARK
jgi:hypothetical protein